MRNIHISDIIRISDAQKCGKNTEMCDSDLISNQNSMDGISNASVQFHICIPHIVC